MPVSTRSKMPSRFLAAERGKMGDVYGQAYLTIASPVNTCPCQGLSIRESPPAVFTVPFVGPSFSGSYNLRLSDIGFGHDFIYDVENTRYNRRGWTFQERFLSRRLLYFGEGMLHYECQQCERSEDSTAIRQKAHPR